MSNYPYDIISQDEVKLEDQTVKAICGCVNVTPYIETLPCGLLNVIEATEAQGQPMAQEEMNEIRRNQREDETLGKWVKAVMDKRLPHRECTVCQTESHDQKEV